MGEDSYRPLISIVIPTYNSEEFIRRTLASVVAQTYRDFEVIISDDGSHDATVATAEDFLERFAGVSWRILRHKHAGPGAARNAGILRAQGEWVSFLDSDDLWLPDKLERVADYLTMHLDASIVCHSVLWLYENGKTRVIAYYKLYNRVRDPFLAMFRRNLLSTSAVTVKRRLLIEAGLFDESLPNNQDYDLWLRLVQLSSPTYLPQVLSIYSVQQRGISANHFRRLDCMLKIEEKYHEEIEKHTAFPGFERRWFRSRAYLSSARALLVDRKLRSGLALFLKAVAVWVSIAR